MDTPLLLPRILLTNDDGIDAEGMAVLAEIVAPMTEELWICAPKEEQSGASQKISLGEPVYVDKRDPYTYAVHGTPADCVALALNYLMTGKPPTLVISGVNATSNFGDETALSGTVGAALTGLMHGIPSIAISQDGPRGNIPWETTRAVLPLVLTRLLHQGWRKETCPSINIPDCPPEKITGMRWAKLASKNVDSFKIEKRVSLRDKEYYWMALNHKQAAKQANNEEACLARGEVSIVALSLDRSVEMDHALVLFTDPLPNEEASDTDDNLLIE